MSDIKIHLLLVDDKKFMRDIILSYLERDREWTHNGKNFEFEISTAVNGEEAVLKYAKNKHEIVIMDLDMEVMDGLTATKQILEINPKARIIGMASEGDENVEEFKVSGIKFFLEKPFQDTYIYTRIESLIAEMALEKPLEDYDVRKLRKSIWQKLFSK